MQTKIETWEDLDFGLIVDRVFQVQRRIFRASQAGDYETMHKHQRHLVQMFHTRALAVYLAAEVSDGRSTAGVDGKKNLTAPQKLKLAQSLRLSNQPDPVLRKQIPKPGSQDTRPLGIPTIADRALQHLIRMALEPEWEARFDRSMYGFRKGRSCHDALINIRLNIQRCPKWVLDADIEKFFDRLDHDALLKKLDTFPAMHKAIHRVLKAGMMEGEILNPTELGTPQGGPLSPLLANIALCGMEYDLIQAFPPERVIDNKRIVKPPRIVTYADDFVVLHESKAVVEECSRFIADWLSPLGLNLSPTKTSVRHTLKLVDGNRGIEFLGCEIRQHAADKHQIKPFFNGVYTHIGPSKKAQKRIYAECARIIDEVVLHKKRNAEYAYKEAKGEETPVERLIKKLNAKLGGWAAYHRSHHSKRAFSTLDHKLFIKLLRWAKRRHPRWSRKRLIDEYFNGGTPWSFRAPGKEPKEEVILKRVDSTPIKRHIPIRSEKSFYDGDWAYWGKRSGDYPGIPWGVSSLLQRQNGKCWHCNRGIESSDRVAIQKIPGPKDRAVNRLVHEPCSALNRRYPTRDAFVR
ncbi:MAG: reverse transcriptase N-terminal domain-containing protein [Verrucomicrobiales bacterium]|nr:reverse transcriptase N-terminal domain-containing protein [Verrucomicrobiales bacterium]